MQPKKLTRQNLDAEKWIAQYDNFSDEQLLSKLQQLKEAAEEKVRVSTQGQVTKPQQKIRSLPQLLTILENQFYDTNKQYLTPEGIRILKEWLSAQATEKTEQLKRVIPKMLNGSIKVSLTPQRKTILETVLKEIQNN